MDTLKDLHCERATTQKKLEITIINEYLKQIKDWQLSNDITTIYRSFEFKNFKQTMFFVNALAYICEQECHHPDLQIGYNYCKIMFTTHELSGLSKNDFICAAKINQLLSSKSE